MGFVGLFGSAMTACGPSHVKLDPRNVSAIAVRPASKELLYCPGRSFQVEVVATLRDGTSCSSTNAAHGCLTKKDAVIDPEEVRIEGTSGGQTDKKEKWIWAPAPNPLETAATPFYPDAVLIRVESGGVPVPTYLISQSADQPVKIERIEAAKAAR